MARIDRDAWSGEGDLTASLLERLASIEQVGFVRVEDAPGSRSGAGFTFIWNDVYVAFRTRRSVGLRWLFGLLPLPVIGRAPSLTLAGLEQILSAADGIGPSDYSDAAMLQYLRSDRVIPPYQTRGPKLVEMVRIYQAGP